MSHKNNSSRRGWGGEEECCPLPPIAKEESRCRSESGQVGENRMDSISAKSAVEIVRGRHWRLLECELMSQGGRMHPSSPSAATSKVPRIRKNAQPIASHPGYPESNPVDEFIQASFLWSWYQKHLERLFAWEMKQKNILYAAPSSTFANGNKAILEL